MGRLLLAIYIALFCVYPSNVKAEGSPKPPARERVLELWSAIEVHLKDKDIKAANQAFNQLDTVKQEAGINEFPAYSFSLLRASETLWAAGEKENAKFLVRKAIELSPHSPTFLLEATPSLVNFGLKTHFEVFVDILRTGFSRYDFLCLVLIKLTYPLLWALTFSSLACAFLLFLANMHEILARIRKILPKTGSSYSSPLLLLACLTVPLLGGPVWTVIANTLLIYLFLPKQRLFAGFCSIVIILWATMIPLRENMRIWFYNPGIQSMLSAASGIFTPDTTTQLAKLVEERKQDSLLLFLYAKTLKRDGEFLSAEKIMQQLKREMGPRFEIEAELGMMKFFLGDTEHASSIYKELEKSHTKNAALLYNYSKIRFDEMDTEESRSLFERANERNHSLAQNLRTKEELFGLKSPFSAAEYYLPFTYILKSALMPFENTRANSDKIAVRFLPLLDLTKLAYIGTVLLFVMFIISKKPKPKKQGRPPREYCRFQTIGRIVSVIPAGLNILNGEAIKAFFIATIVSILTMPLLNWPAETSGILSKLSGLELYYVYGYCFLIAALSYVGFTAYEGGVE